MTNSTQLETKSPSRRALLAGALGGIGAWAAPAPNRARLFVKDNGAGKTQLCVRFHTGAVKVITTEP